MQKEEQYKYIADWKRQNVRRVPLELSPDQHEELKEVAKVAGESVNGYIKKAIWMRIEAEKAAEEEENEGQAK